MFQFHINPLLGLRPWTPLEKSNSKLFTRVHVQVLLLVIQLSNFFRSSFGDAQHHTLSEKNSVAHEATQSVAKMLIHTSVALSATVVWLTYTATLNVATATLNVAIRPHLMWL